MARGYADDTKVLLGRLRVAKRQVGRIRRRADEDVYGSGKTSASAATRVQHKLNKLTCATKTAGVATKKPRIPRATPADRGGWDVGQCASRFRSA